jgi:hypothetical protein
VTAPSHEPDARIALLTADVALLEMGIAELQQGQHELLRMYEELRELYPRTCLCSLERERAQRYLATFDVLAPEPNHEDYVPGENEP